MELPKAFDTVDHKKLISKLKIYGVAGNNLIGSKVTYNICKNIRK